MSHLREFTMNTPEPDVDLIVQLLRAQYAERVAEALYQAAKLSKHARLSDAPAVETVSQYRDIAEAAVMMVCDETLLLAADYYAAACINAEQNIDLGLLTVKARVNMVRNWRTGLHGWLRLLRGMYPEGFPKYRDLADTDKAHMRALRQAANVRMFPPKEGA